MNKSIPINRINEIIDKEMEFAVKVNPQMAFGMQQIKKLLNDEAERYEKFNPEDYGIKPEFNDTLY